MARIVEFIETHETVGNGTNDNAVRSTWQLWTKEGELILEYDQLMGECLIKGVVMKCQEKKVETEEEGSKKR